MPRRKTIQPEPLEILTAEDGLVIEIRDAATRLIGRGEDKKFDFSALSKTSGSKAPKDAKKGKVIKGKAQSHADNKKEEELDEGLGNMARGVGGVQGTVG
jgi:hypothetical protein